MRKIALIGGDCRQIHAAAAFQRAGLVPCVFGNDSAAKEGFTAPYTLKETLADAKAVVLPVPSVKKKGFLYLPQSEYALSLSDFLQVLPDTAILFLWGKENCPVTSQNRVVDLAEDEILLIENARLTAEAALAVALSQSQRSLLGTRATVVGYGRIGRNLCRLLSAVGAQVQVVSREGRNKESALASGFTVLPPEKTALFSQTDLIFNTVPLPILDEKSFAEVSPKTLYLELASSPGGIDPVCAASLPIDCVSAQGLPGKYCRVSAGEALAQAVLRYLEVETW